ncbi:prolyl oligopeptidase family serine peptidase [Pontiella agarivorans]|uniref:Prolyl oligopeptidase family serine peptidase n=1 Tax=Pontiella agarivorans TaxID=3038953 RepID=A0ABU5MWI5_9BACT|nr:prolyl oligopeptidase family serine peptidase [Pontiella agarivorans]MDZ8118498.1 prolyl oligopeptidase family serine peptidase [Pontiella agarivorans]
MMKQLTTGLLIMTMAAMAQNDPFQWLEEVDSEKAMAWVEQQNADTLNVLTNYPKYNAVYEKTLEILNSQERIAYPGIRGSHFYNFWQDAEYPRGVWRRTTPTEYAKKNPEWEVMLDVAELAEKENEKWSYKGVDVLAPDFDVALVKLSRGGGDAVVVREFDMHKKAFIENGFKLDEAKTRVSWLDRDTLLVGTDFGEGSLTSSGYPRQVKKWKRGTPLSEAELIFEGETSDVSVGAYVQRTAERNYVMVYRGISFYESEYRAYENGKLIPLDIPLTADLSGIFKNHLLVTPKKEWNVAGKTVAAGSLVALDYEALLKGKHAASILFQPSEKDSLGDVSSTENQLIVRIFKGGRFDEFERHTFSNGKWAAEKIDAPEFGTLSVVSADDYSDRFFFTHESALRARALYFSEKPGSEIVKMKSMPEFFDPSGFEVKLHEAVSKDGTKIPYSVVFPKAGKMDGTTPTLLYGYGGFEVSLRPFYSPVMGSTWLANGGAFAVANIRGGGEFGPAWHDAARKENKQKSYDDFIAVSEDLIKHGYASPETLGIQGGSNGGLLVGAVTMQRPDLFRAVICEVPLLDMKRYHKLLAGASWMAEYGDPDNPDEWAYIKKYSPYQKLYKDRKYPKVFFKTTTRDDRVHPGHARKMAAKMKSMGHPVFYFENTEGGHGAGVTNEQRAQSTAISYVYLLKMLSK